MAVTPKQKATITFPKDEYYEKFSSNLKVQFTNNNFGELQTTFVDNSTQGLQLLTKGETDFAVVRSDIFYNYKTGHANEFVILGELQYRYIFILISPKSRIKRQQDLSIFHERTLVISFYSESDEGRETWKTLVTHQPDWDNILVNYIDKSSVKKSISQVLQGDIDALVVVSDPRSLFLNQFDLDGLEILDLRNFPTTSFPQPEFKVYGEDPNFSGTRLIGDCQKSTIFVRDLLIARPGKKGFLTGSNLKKIIRELN